MSLAWLAYIPVPGLALVPAWVDGQDRLTRFHAWQGGALVLLFWVGLILIGFLGRASDAGGFQTFVGTLSLGWIVAALVGMVWGIVASARGEYQRIRPVYDVLALFGR